MRRDDLTKRLDRVAEEEADSLAAVPAIIFVGIYLVVLYVSVRNCLLHPADRTMFHDYVTVFGYGLGGLFCLGLSFCVLWPSLRFRRLSKPNVTFALFLAFLILAGVSTASNPDNLYRYTGVWPSLVGINSYFALVILYYWCTSHANSKKARSVICNALVASSLPLGIHALWVAYTYGSPQSGISIRPTGIFYNSNHYGYYLAVVIVLCAALAALAKSKALRALYLAGFVYNSVVLDLNNTLGAWLAVVAGLVAVCVATGVTGMKGAFPPWALIALYLAVLSIASIWDQSMLNSLGGLLPDMRRVASNTSDAGSAGSGRWRLWVATARFIVQRPLLGWGAEGISDDLLLACNNPRTHSEPLMYAAFFGIPAALCFYGACASVFVRAIKRAKEIDALTLACLCAAFTYLVSSAVGNICFYTAPLLFIMLGLSEAGVNACESDVPVALQ